METATRVDEKRSSGAPFFVACGAVLAGLGVAAGALGAHGLEGQVTPDRLDIYETGVLYHLIHALALLIVGWAVAQWPSSLTRYAGWCILAGIVIFSGSLYLLVLTDTPWLGAVTPIGGVAFIAGWMLLAWGVVASA